MKSKAIFLIALFPLALPLHATELSLVNSIEQAWGNSTLFKSQLEGQKTLYDISSSDRWRRFLLNEPQVQYAKNDNSTAEVYTLAESIGFPGKSIALSRLDKARQRSQWAEWQARKYEIARDVAAAHLEAAITTELVDQQKKNIADLEALQKSLQARYEAGMATQAETLVNELQLRQQKADLIALEDKAVTASQRLNRLLGFTSEVSQSYELPDDLDEHIISQLEDKTADEMRAQAALKLAEANHTTAFWSQLPDLTFGVSRNHYLLPSGSPNGEEITRSYSVGVAFLLFYPFTERVEANRQRAQAQTDKAAAEVQRLNAEKDRQDALREYTRSKTRLKELREKDLPYAEALMESTFSAYKSGKLGIAELVLARKTLTDIRALDVQLRGSIINAHLRCLKAGGV